MSTQFTKNLGNSQNVKQEFKMSLEKLIENVENWANKRGIFEKSNPDKQQQKTEEEILEFADAFNEMIDALGDIQVTLILQCKMQGYDYAKLIKNAKVEYQNGSKPFLVGFKSWASQSAGMMLFNNNDPTEENITNILTHVVASCQKLGVSSEYCLETAYNVIKDRTGEMVDGLFVKSETTEKL